MMLTHSIPGIAEQCKRQKQKIPTGGGFFGVTVRIAAAMKSLEVVGCAPVFIEVPGLPPLELPGLELSARTLWRKGLGRAGVAAVKREKAT